MRESSSLHVKVQEMCDCFATTDPLKEMSKMQHESEAEEAAVKWIALAVLHGINDNAKKISIRHDEDGSVEVTATYRKAKLPPPDSAIAAQIIADLRDIIHLEKSKGRSKLAIGVRDSSLELEVSAKEKGSGSKLTITFP